MRRRRQAALQTPHFLDFHRLIMYQNATSRDRLVGANHRLVGANHRLAAANLRLAGANDKESIPLAGRKLTIGKKIKAMSTNKRDAGNPNLSLSAASLSRT